MTIINCPSCDKEYNVTEKYNGKKVKCLECSNSFIVKFDLSENKEKEAIIESDSKKQIEHKKEYIKEDDIIIKPNKISYIFLGNTILIFLSIITFISSIFFYEIGLVFGPITILTYFLIKIKYKKEEYIITDKKIIYNYGNIFSDNSVEVNLDKVTQVTTILGFIQYNIFNTGNLIVKTAGSSSSKINLKNIDKTMDIYDIFQKRMQKNGFHLQKDKLVQTAKPHWLGIIGEVFGKIFSAFIVIFFIIGNLFTELNELGYGHFGEYISIPLILFSLMILLILIFSYLDLKRREYNVFTDSIFYTEGFLTKNFSFLPMESVADTENIQSFWSKIFGLHDVVISSEGSENKVIFKNMVGGDTMMKNVKYLKDNIIMGTKDIIEGEGKTVNSLIGFKDKIEKPLDYDKSFKGEYKMSMLKSIIVTLPFLIYPPVFIFVLISNIIKVIFTRFIIDESSIEMKFEFLSNKHNSFSIEKITGINIHESILDKLLGTCSISFWSIGSSKSITFSNIKKSEGLEEKVLGKIGIKIEEEAKEIVTNFNLLDYFKSSIIYGLFLVILIFIISIVGFISNDISLSLVIQILFIFIILYILIYIYKVFYYNKKRYIQKLHEHFIESISGIFFIKKSYVLFRNIKGVKSVKYPLTNTGNININVAGEQVVQSKNKKSISILSNSISISFVDRAFEMHTYIDGILNGNDIDDTLVKSSKQDIGNSIVGFIIFGIIFFIFVILVGVSSNVNISILFSSGLSIGLFFGIIIGLLIWSIKVKNYNFEKQRVLYSFGIIYKRKHSILYSKFNFIEKNQGFINKIFKNGIIKIYTLGGGSVEMKITDIDNYKDIYELLKKD